MYIQCMYECMDHRIRKLLEKGGIDAKHMSQIFTIGFMTVGITDDISNFTHEQRINCSELMHLISYCLKHVMDSLKCGMQTDDDTTQWTFIVNKLLLRLPVLLEDSVERKNNNHSHSQLIFVKEEESRLITNGGTDYWLSGLFHMCAILIRCLSEINAYVNLPNKELQPVIDFFFHRALFNAEQNPLCQQSSTRKKIFELLQLLTQYSNDQISVYVINKLHAHIVHDQYLRRKYVGIYQRSHWFELNMILDRDLNLFCGLYNEGATCYLNSLMQQLFHNRRFRYSILTRNVHSVVQKQMALRIVEQKEQKEQKEEKEEKKEQKEEIKKTIIGDSSDMKCDMLFQLQKLFANLQESKLVAYRAKDFCNSFNINVGIQMDVDEFMVNFTDKLSKQLQCDSQQMIFEYLFGGVFATQILGQNACHHYRERADPFVSLTLPLIKSNENKNKSLNLNDILRNFVSGEVIESYHCDQCQCRCQILKRSCIRILPRNLIIHLKRFDFNVETMSRTKINDRLEFGPYLDMSEYTKHGLELRENEKHEIDFGMYSEEEMKKYAKNEKAFADLYNIEDKQCNLYKLVGIINHSGGTESGHYTSYVLNESASWILLNDKSVSKFDANRINSECFGGDYKCYSAYMLFYQRIIDDDEICRVQHLIEDGIMQNCFTAKEMSKSTADTSTNLVINSTVNDNSQFPAFTNIECGRKRMFHERKYDLDMKMEPPALKKQKINDLTIDEHSLRENLSKTSLHSLPLVLQSVHESQLVEEKEKYDIWQRNHCCSIERQIYEKSYMKMCVEIALNEKNILNDKLLECSIKFLTTFICETASHYSQSLLWLKSVNSRKRLWKLFSCSPTGCQWFLNTVLKCDWIELLFCAEKKSVRLLADDGSSKSSHDCNLISICNIVRNLIIQAMMCIRSQEIHLYVQSTDEPLESCIQRMILKICSLFTELKDVNASVAIFEVLKYLSHFGREERILLINCGVLWRCMVCLSVVLYVIYSTLYS